jgi:hypothetical protein
MRNSVLSLLSVSCALLLSSVAHAQTIDDFPRIRLGEEVSGSVVAGGPTFTDRGPFVVYRFDATAGTRYSVQARSGVFDTYLVLARPVGGLTEFIRENDDAGEGTDSRIRFTADRTGPYLLVVQPLQSGTTGPFTLRVDERVLPPDQPPRPVTLAASVQGQLSEGSSVLLTEWDEEYPYDLWTLTGSGGEYYEISMESEAFDAYLEFGPMSGGTLMPDRFDDDGGEGTDARLRVQLPHDGTFGIRARPLVEGAGGTYTLRVDAFVPPPPARAPIAAGQIVTSVLDAEDAILEDGVPYEEWLYQGRAGERLTLRMASDELDSYLSVGTVGPTGVFGEIASNDDGPDDGLNAVIDLTLSADGEFVIRARSLGAGASGSYTLEVRPGR